MHKYAGYQPKKGLGNPEPPSGGSGVFDKNEEQKNMCTANKARLIQALGMVLHAELNTDYINRDENLVCKVREKIKELIEHI